MELNKSVELLESLDSKVKKKDLLILFRFLFKTIGLPPGSPVFAYGLFACVSLTLIS